MMFPFRLFAATGDAVAQIDSVDGTRAVVAVTDWRPAAQASLAERLDAVIEVEPLGLEDNFIELHS